MRQENSFRCHHHQIKEKMETNKKRAIRSTQSQHVLHKIIDVRRCPEMPSLQWVRGAEFHGGKKHQTFLITCADVAKTKNRKTYGSSNLQIKKKKRQTRHRAKKNTKKKGKNNHLTTLHFFWTKLALCRRIRWKSTMMRPNAGWQWFPKQKKISDIRRKRQFSSWKCAGKKRRTPLMWLRKFHQSTHPTPPPLSRTPTPATHKHHTSCHQHPGKRSVYDISIFLLEGGTLHRSWSDGR